MNSRLQKQLEGLSARVAKLQEDFGVVRKGFGVVEKAGTAVNDPPVPSIDGQRDIIAELLAESVSRGDKVVRSAMLNDETFVAGLAHITTNQPNMRVDLLTLVREEAGAHPNHNEGVATSAATVEDFKANLAHPMSGDFGRAKEIMRHAKMLADAYRINSPMGIAEGRGFFAVKKSDTPENEWSIRKAAHLGGRMEPEKAKLGRRMSQSEILR